jgi:myosin heavy subunit
VSLFPFMSILACLVGTIVVMICILSIIQAQHMGGRPKKEIALAMDYVKNQEKIDELEARLRESTERLEKSETDEKQLTEMQTKLVTLSRQLDASKSADETSRSLQKELELLILQIEAMRQEKPTIVKEIEKLKQELAARKKNPEDLVPKVVVQPGGTGVAEGGNLYFAEATGGALTLYKSETEKSRVTAGSIGADKEYDEFLRKVAATPGATLVFLVRNDGWYSYVRAAGWAEANFKVKTGKLPIPGKGSIDLGQFKGLRAK